MRWFAMVVLLVALGCSSSDKATQGGGGGGAVGDSTGGDALGADAGGIGDGLAGDTSQTQYPPLPVSNNLWYFFTKTYLILDGSTWALSESQIAGHLCYKVTSINDDYENAVPATLDAQVRVVGDATQDIIFSKAAGPGSVAPSVNTGVTHQEVDDDVSPLWVTRLLPATRNHNMGSAATTLLQTQSSVAPPNQSIAKGVVFDVRTSITGDWGGWDRFDSIAPDFNYLNAVFAYFLDPSSSTAFSGGAAFFTGINFGVRATSSPRDVITGEDTVCFPNTSQVTCQPPCIWDAGSMVCNGKYELEVTWRETLSTGPATLQGPVLRSIKIIYDSKGVLKLIDENIQADFTSGTGEVPRFASWPVDVNIMRGQIDLSGSTFTNAPCAF